MTELQVETGHVEVVFPALLDETWEGSPQRRRWEGSLANTDPRADGTAFGAAPMQHAAMNPEDDNITASRDPRAISIPVYFGPRDRPLFGCLHRPAGAWSGTRVILCAPLGYEGQFAYPALRDLASTLAETTGAAVLRFDYDGCGDSAGGDEDGDRAAGWIASIGHAIDEIKRLAESDGAVVLVGLRAGALLAAMATARRSDVSGIVLWAPCESGRRFVREQQAFAAMAVATATEGNRERTPGARGFDANGYVFTDDAIAGLEALSLDAIESPTFRRALVLDRAELPSKRSAPNRWQASGVDVEYAAVTGYAELMGPRWLSKRPVEAFETIAAWFESIGADMSARIPTDAPPLETFVSISPGVTESAAWYDADRLRFGVLTTPAGAPPSHVVVLVTSSLGYRVGPNRMNVAAAREFAALGIATFRMDLAGGGETRFCASKAACAPYDLDSMADLRLAIEYLKQRGYSHIALAGVCAGAFMAWHAASAIGGASHLILVNPETFVPIRYDVHDYMRTWQEPPTWAGRIRWEKGIARSVVTLSGKAARRIARVGAKYLRARLPTTVLQPSLAARIDALGSRGTRTSMIFSADDPGASEMRLQLGPKLRRFQRNGYLTTTYIDGSDHSFTPRWARRALIDAMKHELRGWSRHTSDSAAVEHG